MSLTNRILESSSLLVGIKLIHRLIGLVSLLILARLLTPDDFAIVALVAIIVHFFDILSNAGSEQYIIHKKTIDVDDLNTAWTIDITLKTSLYFLLLIIAGQISVFFDHVELQQALTVSALILIINALKNPGLIIKKRDFEYREIFWLSVFQRFITFIVVLLVAYVDRSYWAIIIGDLVSSIIFTVGSFYIHPHRPKLSLQKLTQQLSFSSWMLVKGVVGYLRSQIDTLIVSKFYSQSLLGQYYMARDIAMMPSHNLLTPLIEPLLAAFSASKEDVIDLERRLRISIFVVGLISTPISVFFYFFSSEVVTVLLGDQWSDSAAMLSMMSLLLYYFSFVIVLEQALIALGQVKFLFVYDLISLGFIFSILIILVPIDIEQFALARGAAGLAMTAVIFIYLTNALKLQATPVLLNLAYLTTISIGSALVVTWMNVNFHLIALSLLVKLSIYGLLYSSITLVLVFHMDSQETNFVKKQILSMLSLAMKKMNFR